MYEYYTWLDYICETWLAVDFTFVLNGDIHAINSLGKINEKYGLTLPLFKIIPKQTISPRQ